MEHGPEKNRPLSIKKHDQIRSKNGDLDTTVRYKFGVVCKFASRVNLIKI